MRTSKQRSSVGCAMSDDARAICAVNTVQFRGGRRYGHNTDSQGFAENFRRQLSGAATDRVLQLGAGGAGAATAYAMLRLGTAHLRIFDELSARAAGLLCKGSPARASRGSSVADIQVE